MIGLEFLRHGNRFAAWVRRRYFSAEPEATAYGGRQLSHQIQIPHIKIKFTTSNTNSPQQKQNRRCKSQFTTSKTNLSHQKRTCHSKNKWRVVFQRTPEHRTTEHRNIAEHRGTSRNTPKTRNTPKKTRNTSQKTRNTSECVCKILRIPPRIEVRNRPLMKRQKPRKVILILQSHKLENFTIFTISKIITSASHSHILIFLRAYLYERANEENGDGEGNRLPLSSSPLARLVHSVFCPAKSKS